MSAKKFDRQKLENTKIRLVRPGPNNLKKEQGKACEA